MPLQSEFTVLAKVNSKIDIGEAVINSKICGGEAVVNSDAQAVLRSSATHAEYFTANANSRSKLDIDFIFAVNKEGIIGVDNRLPWHIPEDLAYFRKMTLGNIIIMGRKTFDSIPPSVLRGRIPIVLTRNPLVATMSDSVKYSTMEHCFDTIHSILTDENRESIRIFVIGGAEIFRAFYPYATRMCITKVDLSLSISSEDVRLPFTFDQIERDFNMIQCDDIRYSRIENTPYRFEIFERREAV